MSAVINLLNTIWTRFSTNLRGTLEGMSAEKWIRLVIIVGAYCLLRPYLMKLAGSSQMKQHETKPEDEFDGPKAKVQPNTLRGQVDIPEDSDDEGTSQATGATTSTDWGKKARKRQRDVLKKMIDAEEKRLAELQEDDEDKDIEEFLVKDIINTNVGASVYGTLRRDGAFNHRLGEIFEHGTVDGTPHDVSRTFGLSMRQFEPRNPKDRARE
ncbi:trafficking PGA2 [Colletotrichum cuscutae]|uniref:Trafficking PGA2 n=1 Tax=Colletotrichum cuscutae TaxID=1209917 RepID=A0AAI9YA01_9PEZI|nr:trafficking PGA2 [Colletotrichum cuscutae]